jgi:hypothetical protein
MVPETQNWDAFFNNFADLLIICEVFAGKTPEKHKLMVAVQLRIPAGCSGHGIDGILDCWPNL